MDKAEKKEYVIKRLREKVIEFGLSEDVDKIPLSEKYVEVEYNDGIKEIVDPLSEFYLCKKYFHYFADNYGYILDPANKRVFAFKAYAFQKKLVFPALLDNRYVIFRKCRQVGISVISGLYALWRANFNIAQFVLIISKTRKDAQDFKEKAMVTYDRLPIFLKTLPTRDGQNMTTLKLVNNSRMEVRAQSPDAGRGITASLLILDEAAFMPYADEIWSSAFPSLSVSGGQCLIISTSNGVGNFYHQNWLKAESNENGFTPVYIPWWKFPGRDNPWLEKIESEDVAWIEGQLGSEKIKEIQKNLTIRMLKTGGDEAYWKALVDEFVAVEEEKALFTKAPAEEWPWLKKMYEALGPRKFNQEIISRFLGSGNTVISTNTLEEIETGLKEPLFDGYLNDREKVPGLVIIQTPVDDITYTLLSDVASGSGKDYSTMQIFRDDTLEQVAEYKAQIDTKAFGKLIKQVAKYYNQAYVVIETNQGQSVFNEVYASEDDPYQNVFYEFKKKAYRGFHTGPANKKLMIDEFMYNLENGVIKIYSKRTLDELQVFIWHNGKPTASIGYNDDLIMPLMFLSYLLKYGNDHTKLLGFATGTQTVGMTQTEAEEVEEEIIFTKEEEARKFVKEGYGMEWEDYAELMK